MEEGITYERPKKIGPNKVCYWMAQEGILVGSMKKKVVDFLEGNCVKEISDTEYQFKPLKGYNKTFYNIHFSENLQSCTCQASRRSGIKCSHIQTVEAYRFMKKWNN